MWTTSGWNKSAYSERDGSAIAATGALALVATTVNPDAALQKQLRELLVGHTVPRDREIASVTLDGEPVDDYKVSRTNRGNEVLVEAAPGGSHTLEVVAR